MGTVVVASERGGSRSRLPRDSEMIGFVWSVREVRLVKVEANQRGLQNSSPRSFDLPPSNSRGRRIWQEASTPFVPQCGQGTAGQNSHDNTVNLLGSLRVAIRGYRWRKIPSHSTRLSTTLRCALATSHQFVGTSPPRCGLESSLGS